MKTNELIQCRTMDSLMSCIQADSHCVPTVEFTVRNFELPISQTDADYLNQTEINFFAARTQDGVQTIDGLYSSSRQITDPTMTFDIPFVLLGVCVYAYGEPFSMTVEGNSFGPQAAVDALGMPASPVDLRNNAALLTGLFGAAAGTITDFSPAQLEHGHPTWNALWAFLRAYRMTLRCPTSNYEILMDESLADLGNCCSQVNLEGFGASKVGHIYYSRRLNDRISNPQYVFPVAAGAGAVDPGYFVPLNAEQHADGEIVPYRMTAQHAAYGRPMADPAIEQWYRLPCPIPFMPSTKIKISLEREAGDQDYHDRMIEEMSPSQAMHPVNGTLSCNFPLAEDGVAANPTGGIACFKRYPSGMARIGIGLKGFQVRTDVCAGLDKLMKGQTFDALRCAAPELFAHPAGIVSGVPGPKVMAPVGPVCGPDCR